ncbi:hypothetical protein BDF19DRAFT_440815 [Syncephalis fuscata]|nr:hypothetical protein BDF19DRAFT_440815 [Syncephalis fuscata]
MSLSNHSNNNNDSRHGCNGSGHGHGVLKRPLRVTFSTADELVRLVQTVVYDKGKPLVVNMRESCLARSGVFSLDWLERQYGTKNIELYNINTQETLQDWSIARFITYLREQSLSSLQPSLPTIYAKDMRCPLEWKRQLNALLPSHLTYLGPNDLMSHMPKEYRVQNLMCYLGGEKTFTAGHVDLCGSIGHNIMMNSEPGAKALWFIASRADKDKASQFWQLHSNNKHSLDLDDYFMPIDVLKTAPFPIYVIEQRIGDLIVLPSDAAHQVINQGGWSIKVAWNRTTTESLEYSINHALPLYKKLLKPEVYRSKTMVEYALRASIKGLKEMNEHSRKDLNKNRIEYQLKEHLILLNLLRRQLAQEWFELSEVKIDMPITRSVELERLRKCDFCQADIWNRWFHCKSCSVDTVSTTTNHHDYDRPLMDTEDGYDLCITCYSLGRSCHDPKHLQLWEYQWPMTFIQLYQWGIDIYNDCIAQQSLPLALLPSFNPTRDLHGLQRSPMSVAYQIYGHIRDQRFGGKCERCNRKSNYTLVCKRHGTICAQCLWRQYHEHFFILLYERQNTCPNCRKIMINNKSRKISRLIRYSLPEENPVHQLSMIDQEQWLSPLPSPKHEQTDTVLAEDWPPLEIWKNTSVSYDNN